ncbi:PREDICTED: RNA-directed DNA polymerase from mobile element jockey-like [Papilio xuthus]|uniref:RNA-directed DNA polymerase from mobile element jockey-like n=1 Tax=Papilio xuthus TaxID=66420 RepID=A0AAJ6Z280_PAPXU|nr:PREDICTED: RNA-directed DNA polymerase from mobile element jockey-like [Papilio xuthus]
MTPAMLDEEKADCLADSLEAQCSPSSLPIDPDHLRKVDSEVDRRKSEPLFDSITPVTSDEVEILIKKLRPRKAPGSDSITNRVAKLLPVTIIQLLVAIFNAAMTKGVFPSEWKDAVVIGFLKPSKPPSNPTSYRPISLLKTFGKIYERLVLARLPSFPFWIRKACPLPSSLDFAPNTHALIKCTASRNTYLPNANAALTPELSFYMSSIYKLYEYGVPDRLLCIIRDFLSDRTIRYRVEGVCSQSHPVRAGVPQGSVLGPVLLTLYTNDMPRVHGVELALFADDTCIYTSGRKPDAICRRLQTAANTLGAWFRKWRIEINPTKSAAVYFSRLKVTLLPSVTLMDSPIPWEDNVKYLGVILDSKLNFSAHVTRVRNRAAFILGRLYALFNKKSKMSLWNKVTLYKSVVRPVMTYASRVFAHIAPKQIHRLQVIQNRFLRRATGAPWYMRNSDLHIDLDLPTIAQHLKLASRRYFDSAVGHPNPLVVSAATYNPISLGKFRRDHRRPRNVLDFQDDPMTIAQVKVKQHRQTTRRSRCRLRQSFSRYGLIADNSNRSSRGSALSGTLESEC